MKYALFSGCNIPARVSQYADATTAVFEKLDIELVEFTEFSCCGYPVRNLNQRAFVLSAAKNLAVAESAGLNIMAMCKCCYGSLKKAEDFLSRDQDLKKDVNAILTKEKLHYEGRIRVNHLLEVLHRDVGLKHLKPFILKPYSGLQIAVSYGCHALRPSKITGFDNPVSPVLFDELVEITGAYSVEAIRNSSKVGLCRGITYVLRVERIGHGTRAREDPVCSITWPSTRFPSKCARSPTCAPRSFPRFSSIRSATICEQGLLVTVNTDDPKMFNNSLALEYELLERELGFSRDEIRIADPERRSLQLAAAGAQGGVEALRLQADAAWLD